MGRMSELSGDSGARDSVVTECRTAANRPAMPVGPIPVALNLYQLAGLRVLVQEKMLRPSSATIA